MDPNETTQQSPEKTAKNAFDIYPTAWYNTRTTEHGLSDKMKQPTNGHPSLPRQSKDQDLSGLNMESAATDQGLTTKRFGGPTLSGVLSHGGIGRGCGEGANKDGRRGDGRAGLLVLILWACVYWLWFSVFFSE